eukprot:NODE_137_length_18042_cov_0.768823.p6 type:complete len:295 gc:universal NODE_137_length_18042_cov_0.768823:14423-15307(+)
MEANAKGTDIAPSHPERVTISDIKESLKRAEINLEANRTTYENEPEYLLASANICMDYHNKSQFADMGAEVLNARVFAKLSEATSIGVSNLKMGDTEIKPQDLGLLYSSMENSEFGLHINKTRMYLCDHIWKNVFLDRNSEPANSKIKSSQGNKKLDLQSEVDEDNMQETAESITKDNFFIESSHYVRKVKECLQIHAVQPISLFDFAFDPESFSKTVENLYYISFLVRDGNCKITQTDDMIYIQNSMSKATKDDFSKGFKRKSFILTLETQQWRGIISKYGIESSIIPSNLDN